MFSINVSDSHFNFPYEMNGILKAVIGRKGIYELDGLSSDVAIQLVNESIPYLRVSVAVEKAVVVELQRPRLQARPGA